MEIITYLRTKLLGSFKFIFLAMLFAFTYNNAFAVNNIELEGEISSINVNQITVAGMDFIIGGNTTITLENGNTGTILDLLQGDFVKIKGYENASVFFATSVKVDSDLSDNKIEVDGTVDNVSTTTITLESLTFNVDSNTEIQFEDGTQADISEINIGDYVEIEAMYEAGVWVASEIKIDKLQDPVTFEIEGDISSIGVNTIVVDGQQITIDTDTQIMYDDETTVTFAELQVGMDVEVKGTIQNNVYLADEIKIDDEDQKQYFEATAPIFAVTDSSIVLQSVEILVNDSTDIILDDDQIGTLSDLMVGWLVEVEGYWMNGTLYATKIKVEDADDDDEKEEFKVKGAIDAVTATSVTVEGIEFMITTTTQITLEDDQPGTIADLLMGSIVEVEGYIENGVYYAEKIKIEDDDDQEVEVKGNITVITDSSITVNDIKFIIDINTMIFDDDDMVISLDSLVLGDIVEILALKEGDRYLAIEVRVDDDSMDDDGQEIEIKGRIQSISGNTITVNGIEFTIADTTEILLESGMAGTIDDLTTDMHVEIHGYVSGNNIIATRIEVEDEGLRGIQVKGHIQALTSSTVTVKGIQFMITAETVFQSRFSGDITIDSLSEGMEVMINGRTNGTTYYARKIKLTDKPVKQFELKGTITVVMDSIIHINNTSFLITDNTIIIDDDGTEITIDELATDIYVEVVAYKNTGQSSGNAKYVATYLKVEDRSSSDDEQAGEIQEIDDNKIIVDNMSYIINDNTIIYDRQGNERDLEFLTVGQDVEVVANLRNDARYADEIYILSPVSVEETTIAGMEVYNAPNPFVATTTIYFNLPQNGNVRIEIYDQNGQLVESNNKGFLNRGDYTYTPEANYSAGAYYFRIYVDGRFMAGRMIKL